MQYTSILPKTRYDYKGRNTPTDKIVEYKNKSKKKTH